MKGMKERDGRPRTGNEQVNGSSTLVGSLCATICELNA